MTTCRFRGMSFLLLLLYVSSIRFWDDRFDDRPKHNTTKKLSTHAPAFVHCINPDRLGYMRLFSVCGHVFGQLSKKDTMLKYNTIYEYTNWIAITVRTFVRPSFCSDRSRLYYADPDSLYRKLIDLRFQTRCKESYRAVDRSRFAIQYRWMVSLGVLCSALHVCVMCMLHAFYRHVIVGHPHTLWCMRPEEEECLW